VRLRRQFRELLQIANKERTTVPFDLNEHQLTYQGNKSTRDVLLKSRQMGFSTCILGEKFLKCISVRNTKAAIISHDNKSTEQLFMHVHFFEKHCQVPIRTSRSSRYEMVFPDTDSTFYVGTAGAREFGRGDTITDLHCSEFAFWPNPEKIVRGLFQAVPKTGHIVLESTANGYGNSYHRRCLQALKGTSTWKLHFYPWYIANEYQLFTDSDFAPSEEELRYALKVKEATGVTLTSNQLLWRRLKIEEFGEDRQAGITPERYFEQEYPHNFDSAFLTSGSSIFAQLGIDSAIPPKPPTPLFANGYAQSPDTINPAQVSYHPPKASAQYVIGADPAEGLMQDESVAEVLECCRQPKQVAEYASAEVAPDEFAYVLAKMGKKYNNARIVVERNNHGLATLSILKRIYPIGLIYKERRLATRDRSDPTGEVLGIRTTLNKAKMVDDLYALLRDGLTYYSAFLDDELKSFVEIRSQTGHILLRAQEGCMDNRVMALVMASQGYLSMHRSISTPSEKVIPFNSVAAMHKRMRKTRIKDSLIDNYIERFC